MHNISIATHYNRSIMHNLELVFLANPFFALKTNGTSRLIIETFEKVVAL